VFLICRYCCILKKRKKGKKKKERKEKKKRKEMRKIKRGNKRKRIKPHELIMT
jgi:hypothetical protein